LKTKDNKEEKYLEKNIEVLELIFALEVPVSIAPPYSFVSGTIGML
jgi:hypothetical protein